MSEALKFDSSLDSVKKAECSMMYKSLDMLLEFSKKANFNLFVYLFGEKLGNHLCWKYTVTYRKDFMKFFNFLDLDNKGIIVVNILHNKDLYSNC